MRFAHALILLLFLLCAGCNEKLIHDLTEHDANRVVSRLHKDGITGSKVQQADGRWSIEVTQSDTVKALSVIDSSRILSQRKSGDTRGKGASLLPTREEQWFQYESQVAGALEVTLMTLPGVVDAHVHLHLPPSDPLLGIREKGGGSGSVLLITESQSLIQDEEVAKMVAGGAGIPPEQVRVLRSMAATVPAELPNASDAVGSGMMVTTGGHSAERVDFLHSFSKTTLYLAGVGFVVISVLSCMGMLLIKSKRRKRDLFILPSQEPLAAQVRA